MPLPLALLGIQAGLGAAQGIGGLMAASKNKAPQYTMPGEYKQNLAAAQMRAAGGLPAASRQLAEQQIARGTAASLNKLQDRNMVATGVAGLAQAQADQANKLAAMDADARLRGELQVANARVAIAGAKDKEFAIKQQDYLRKAAANSALINAGIQNVVGAGQAFSMNDMMKQYYKLGKYAPNYNKTYKDTLGEEAEALTNAPSIGVKQFSNETPALGLKPSSFNMGFGMMSNQVSPELKYQEPLQPMSKIGIGQIANNNTTLGLKPINMGFGMMNNQISPMGNPNADTYSQMETPMGNYYNPYNNDFFSQLSVGK